MIRLLGYLARQDERAPSNLLTLTGEKHANRRRVWNRGFNAGALEEYDEILAKSATQLVDGIQARSESQGEVDLTTWFNYFRFLYLFLKWGHTILTIIRYIATISWQTSCEYYKVYFHVLGRVLIAPVVY